MCRAVIMTHAFDSSPSRWRDQTQRNFFARTIFYGTKLRRKKAKAIEIDCFNCASIQVECALFVVLVFFFSARGANTHLLFSAEYERKVATMAQQRNKHRLNFSFTSRLRFFGWFNVAINLIGCLFFLRRNLLTKWVEVNWKFFHRC